MWPGVSITSAVREPTLTRSPSPTSTSTAGIFAGLAARRDDAAMVALLELRDAGGVVAVMVGDEDVGQLPAAGSERGLDGRRLRGVDGGGGAGRGIVDEDAVIVLEAEKQPGLRSHWSVHE